MQKSILTEDAQLVSRSLGRILVMTGWGRGGTAGMRVVVVLHYGDGRSGRGAWCYIIEVVEVWSGWCCIIGVGELGSGSAIL